jgi:hypothetical protein
MHHLLAHASTASIPGARAHFEILVSKFAPHARDLHPFRPIRLHQKVVSHFSLPRFLISSSKPSVIPGHEMRGIQSSARDPLFSAIPEDLFLHPGRCRG